MIMSKSALLPLEGVCKEAVHLGGKTSEDHAGVVVAVVAVVAVAVAVHPPDTDLNSSGMTGLVSALVVSSSWRKWCD